MQDEFIPIGEENAHVEVDQTARRHRLTMTITMQTSHDVVNVVQTVVKLSSNTQMTMRYDACRAK